MTTIIETKRLILRTWKKEDIEPYYQINQDKKVTEFLLGALSMEQVKDFIKAKNQQNDKRGQQRNALHYAVMRHELVKKEIILDAAQRGEVLTADGLEQKVVAALEQHPDVISVLKIHSKVPVDYNACNKAGNTAKKILERDLDRDHPLTVATALKCLSKLKEVPESKPEKPPNDESISMSIHVGPQVSH